METSLKSIRAMIYFMFDKGIDFDTDEVEEVFELINDGWMSFWELEDVEAKKIIDKAYIKVLDILEKNKCLAEYFLTNSK